jgi:hypothetical protein
VSSLENDAEPVQPEEIAAPQLPGMLFHLLDGHSAHLRRADERPDARACVNARLDSQLGESAQHSDMCEPLETTSAKYKRNLPLPDARLGFSLGGCDKRIRQL